MIASGEVPVAAPGLSVQRPNHRCPGFRERECDVDIYHWTNSDRRGIKSTEVRTHNSVSSQWPWAVLHSQRNLPTELRIDHSKCSEFVLNLALGLLCLQ